VKFREISHPKKLGIQREAQNALARAAQESKKISGTINPKGLIVSSSSEFLLSPLVNRNETFLYNLP
jgi:hypothetical protein